MYFENILYRKIHVPANETDGETPDAVYVTKEVNGIAVFFDSFKKGVEFLKWFPSWDRDGAIEYAFLVEKK